MMESVLREAIGDVQKQAKFEILWDFTSNLKIVNKLRKETADVSDLVGDFGKDGMCMTSYQRQFWS